jgi:succinylglutamate desuccinylase
MGALTPECGAAADRSPLERIVIDHDNGDRGPCLVVFAGLHGDETAGVDALRRVRETLSSHSIPIKGRLLGVLGNLPALKQKTRYIDRDLNRTWWEDEIASLAARAASATDCVEDAEMRSLIHVIEGVENETRRPVVFLDLHSTSADGLPFTCIPDTIANLKIALRLPIPVILNLEETIDGPLAGYMSDLGYGGVIVEGGRHDDPRTVDVLESAVWILLEALRCVKRESIPGFQSCRERLAGLCVGLPRVMEVKDLHRTVEGDGFVMEPGFTHYTRVEKEQLLASDNTGELRASRSGRVLMPLYKPPSDHGYFITEVVHTRYVRLLYFVRWLRLDRVAHLLPGISRDPDHPNYLKIASWTPERLVNMIRLLGWRRLYRGTRHSLLRRRRVLKA